MFSTLLETIKKVSYIQSQRLITIYEEIMKFVNILQTEQKEGIFVNLRKHISELQAQEVAEREKEGKEVETMLKNM